MDDDTIALIQELAKNRFYGSLTLKFEAGKVVVLKREETIKPKTLSRQSRKHEPEPF